jgi:hypothetical protein
MKQCPLCKQVYDDADLNFCLSDGAPLLENAAEQPTIVRSAPVTTGLTPASPKGVHPVFAYLTVGFVALLIGGGVVAWLMSRTNDALSANTANFATKNENQPAKPTAYMNPVVNGSNTASGTPVSLPKDASLVKREVNKALNGWVETLLSHNLDSHLQFYADRLDGYFRKTNVDVSYVRNDNARLFRKYSSFGLSMSNLEIHTDPSGEQVVTTFDSTFDFKGERASHSGMVQSEFRWKEIDGNWKIISQKDLKTYHVNKK